MICHPCAVEATMLRRRPVEYNLIHDDSKSEPEIEVNSKKVEVVSWHALSQVVNPSNAQLFFLGCINRHLALQPMFLNFNS